MKDANQATVTLRRSGDDPQVMPLNEIPVKRQVLGAEVLLPGDPRPWRIFKIDFPPGWRP